MISAFIKRQVDPQTHEICGLHQIFDKMGGNPSECDVHERQRRRSPKGLKDPFGDASNPEKDNLLELVRLLARIAADNDYNKLLDESKSSYNGPKEKGPN